MAYFSLKKIGTLAILPMITLASVTAEADAAPQVRALSQSQSGQVSPGSRFVNQKLKSTTNDLVIECLNSLAVATTEYNHSSAEEARQAGIKKWESKAYYAYAGTKPGTTSWNWAASKSIQTRSKQIYVPNHGWNSNGVGNVRTVWQATAKGIPCGQYVADAPAIP